MPDQRTYSSGLIRDIALLEVLARPDAAAGLGDGKRRLRLAGGDARQPLTLLLR